MGGRNKQRSRTESVSGPSRTQTFYSNLLAESLFPGSSETGGALATPTGVEELGERRPDPWWEGGGAAAGYDVTKAYVDAVGPYRSSLPGESGRAKGIRTATKEEALASQQQQLGQTQEQFTQQYQTLLPSFDDAMYEGFFEKYNTGALTPQVQQLTQNVLNVVNNPIAASEEQMENIYEISGANQAFNMPDPEPLTDIVTEIYTGLPTAMTTFMEGVFADASEANIAANLDAMSNAVYEEAMYQGEEMLKATLGDFAAQGVGTSGAALNAIKNGVAQITKQVNSTITQARVQALSTMYSARELGVNLLNQLLERGEQQQALTVSTNLKGLELELSKQLAKVNAHSQIQLQLNDEQRQIFGMAVEEARQDEAAEERTIQFIYNMMTTLATTGVGTSRSVSTSRGSSWNIAGGLTAGISKTYT